MKYGTMSYLASGGKVLMIRKNVREDDPNSGLYTLPGGNLKDFERGSNPKGRLEAGVRETKEETGLTLINSVLKGVVLFDNFERIFPNWSNPKDFLVYMFIATGYTGKLKSKSKEGVPLWVPEIDFSRVPKNIGDERVYGWLRNPRCFMGTIKHKGTELDEQGTFVDYFD